MAEFYWKESGTCAICGTGQLERGFVDAIGDIAVTRDTSEIVGVVDMIVCATCCEQMARLVGSASQQETLDMAHQNMELTGDLEKAYDEAAAWKQRFDGLISNLTEEAKSALGN